MPLQQEAQTRELVIALAGNPNSGKTSIFNNLTGARQHVGNWPGVTVEKKEGRLIYAGKIYKVVDLPGVYSLGAYSEDEIVARNYVLYEKPDVIINVVDASNLERHLYLTVQLLEMGANVVVALNMVDEAKARGISIDGEKLSKLLGVPVVSTVAKKNLGMKELVEQSLKTVNQDFKGSSLKINYGQAVEKEIAHLQNMIATHDTLKRTYPLRWLAVKLLENDERIIKELRKILGTANLFSERAKSNQRLKQQLKDDIENIVIERRFGFISGIVKQAITRKATMEQRLSLSDKIDLVVTHRFLGLPIFILAMWAVFQFTFKLGAPLGTGIETFINWLSGLIQGFLIYANAPVFITSLLIDGVIGGVGSVLVFIPYIFLLFLIISFLEDSGYMARAAYIMDRFMRVLGLQGKSFLPLIIGFGCNVPAVMATRTIEDKQDRIITILINPLMSCTARLPIYLLFAGAFFSAYQGWVVFFFYFLGIVLAIIMAKIFRTLFFKGESTPFVMELPPYRMPTLKGTLIHMWDRGSAFIRKAGTIILGASVVIWILSVLPWGVEYASKESLIGQLGGLLAPIFAPAGFGKWEAASALIFGLVAKEIVVSTLGVIYGVNEEGSLIPLLQQYWTPLSALAFMAMCLIYMPCVATIGVIRKETNSWKWTALAVGYSLVLGWIVAFLIYQGGRLLGFA